MFPMVAEADEFREARGMVEGEVARLTAMGYRRPESLKIGFMLETPSLVFAADRLFQEADFISVGGNDLMQFFFAADRENERVRQRYDTLNFSFLRLLRQLVERCNRLGTPVSFCGEAAGRPLEALVLAADLHAVREVMERADRAGATSARSALRAWVAAAGLPL
jgi:phosphotransferase system enzyme I (PtsP)